MTTCVWDGFTLAADTLRVDGRGTKQPIRKIYDCGLFVYAGTGVLAELPVIARWLTAGAKWEERPVLGEDGGSGIVIAKPSRGLKAVAFLVQGITATLVELPEGPCVAGSGGAYALAAMHCGKDARGAVEVADLFDDGTGLGVDWVDIVSR
jgi:hypothetical protein